MRDLAYLAFLPDPFDLKRSEFFVREAGKTGDIVEPEALQSIEVPIVTIEGSRLVAELCSLNVAPPPELIDLMEPLRLWKGKAKNDGGSRVADPWRLLATSDKSTENEFSVAIFRDIFDAKVLWPDSQEVRLSLFNSMADALEEAWSTVRSGLEAAFEWERFEKIEHPVAQIFYARQRSGIRIDAAMLSDLVEKAQADKYAAYNRIADSTGVSPSGLNHRNVGPLLPKTDAAHLTPFSDAPNFLEYLKLAAENSIFAHDLLTLVRAERDLRALARLRGSTDNFVRPEFQTMGTVTGRILVANPHLQQIRREYRGAIAPDESKRLAYLDYAQFEPGILASLANDEELIARYNEGDVYSQLSMAIFGKDDRRDIAKKMFLSYTYGMSSDRIVELVGGADKADRLAAFETFVSKFEKLAQFRDQSEATLRKDGFVDTLFGNRRYRSGQGELSAADRRWAVSQRVQGTAALIFKEAVLQIGHALGHEGIMLPMHDAVLMSLPTETYARDVAEIQELMLTALKDRCPQIDGRVVAQEHF